MGYKNLRISCIALTVHCQWQEAGKQHRITCVYLGQAGIIHKVRGSRDMALNFASEFEVTLVGASFGVDG